MQTVEWTKNNKNWRIKHHKNIHKFINKDEWVPSAWLLGSDGNKSGISSADRPSTESTTDFGLSFRPCKLFRLLDRCGVACKKIYQLLYLCYPSSVISILNCYFLCANLFWLTVASSLSLPWIRLNFDGGAKYVDMIVFSGKENTLLLTRFRYSSFW